MIAFLLRRLLTTIMIVVGAMVLLFLLNHAIPGDPARVLLGPRATPEMIADLRARMGLDRPVPIQLLKFFWNILQGNLGTDVLSHRPVLQMILDVLPYTIILALSSILLASIIGIPLGCYSAAYRNSIIDRITGIISISTITTPSFVAAIFLLLIFALRLHWFPVIGAGERGNVLDQLWHLILPSLSLALGWIGYIARLVRTSVLEILTEDYIRTSRAYGVAERTVIYKYALRNALIPTIAVLGVGVGSLLGGAVLVEIVFARPGLGFLIYNAIITRNFPVVQGGLVVAVFLYAAANMLADMSYGIIDPRIRTK